MTSVLPKTNGVEEGFKHEALLYAGVHEFIERTSSFIRDSLDAGEPILVVVSAEKIDMLRQELGGEVDGVHFDDMKHVGSNPARIIPAWREFVDAQIPVGRRFRGIGEPISPERTPAELVECQRHEALLNVAFKGLPSWWLVCPYDTSALPDDVIEEAFRSHPAVIDDEIREESATYRNLAELAQPFDAPLTPPPFDAERFDFGSGPLDRLRRFASIHAFRFGLSEDRLGDLVTALNELASNTVIHGPGRGTLRMWRDGGLVIGEVCDAGRIESPLVGRVKPDLGADRGYGLWLANQLCDLVQVRSFQAGSVVRVHVAPQPASS